MSKQMRTLMELAVFAAAILLILSAPLSAASVNQHYKNTTGETAYGLVKIMPGNHTFTYVQLNQPFTTFDTVHWGGCTIAHWSGGTVADGESGHACFSTTSDPATAFATYWLRQNGTFIGAAGPIMGVSVNYEPGTGITVFEIDNEWRMWTGNAYPPSGSDGLGTYVGDVDVSEGCYGVVDTFLWPLTVLDSGVISQLSWTPLTDLNTTLSPGDKAIQTVNVGHYPPQCALILRFNASGDGQESFYVAQQACQRNRVPSLTIWGLVILVVLLTVSTVVVLRRRRHAAV